MPYFTYQAYDIKGRYIEEIIEAQNDTDLIKILHDKKYKIISIKKLDKKVYLFAYEAVDPKSQARIEGEVKAFDEQGAMEQVAKLNLTPLKIKRKKNIPPPKKEKLEREEFKPRFPIKFEKIIDKKKTVEEGNKKEKKEKPTPSKKTINKAKSKLHFSKETYFTLPFFNKVNKDIFVIFLREFAYIFSSGVSIIRSLEILSDNIMDKPLKKVLLECIKDLNNGFPIHKAFEKHPNVFSSVFVNMVRAGESGGRLPLFLNKMAEFYEKDLAIVRKFKSAMTYPTIVFAGAILVVFFLVTYIFPNFIVVFEELNLELPLMTKVLIYIVKFFQNPFAIGVGVAVITLSFMAFFQYIQTSRGRYYIDYLKFRVPIFGNIVRKLAITRFCLSLAILYEGGIGLVQAITISGTTVGNTYFTHVLNEANRKLKESGIRISESFHECPEIFPAVVSPMMSVGEETGRLDVLLKKLSNYFEAEVDLAMETISVLVEPLIIGFLGITVGFILTAVFMPLYQIIQGI